MYFIDTNILVYLHDTKEPEKSERASRIMDVLWEQASGRLSLQVLQEFYVISTRKLKPGLAPAIARKEIQDLMAWHPHPPSAELFVQAWRIEDRFGLSWWDSLIVSSALAQNCATLFTEDLQDGLQIDDLRVVNPFTADFDPATLTR